MNPRSGIRRNAARGYWPASRSPSTTSWTGSAEAHQKDRKLTFTQNRAQAATPSTIIARQPTTPRRVGTSSADASAPITSAMPTSTRVASAGRTQRSVSASSAGTGRISSRSSSPVRTAESRRRRFGPITVSSRAVDRVNSPTTSTAADSSQPFSVVRAVCASTRAGTSEIATSTRAPTAISPVCVRNCRSRAIA